jgi:hypothetical protein
MVEQIILDTFIFETIVGAFVAIDPTEQDVQIGIYRTKEEAEDAFKQYVEKEGIIFE